MSLYGMQKFLYHLNRDPRVQSRYRDDQAALLAEYPLDDEERGAIERGDLGLMYVLGTNGQLLMHFAAYLGMPWADYIQAMRDGVAPPRAGARRRLRDDDGDRREGGRRMSLVFAGVCSHAPGITGRAHLADPALRDPFHAAFRAMGDEMRETRPDALVAGRRRALRQLLHGQHAGLCDRHGRRVRRADRGSGVARHRQDPHSRQCRPRQADRRAR